jgi:tRNA A-37 threonylcarbamoyl transferase component Bud32/class 3 adenylate cyclase
MAGRSLILLSVRVLRKLLSFALWLVVLGFLVLFAANLVNPPKVALPLVTWLRTYGDPAIVYTNSLLELSPSIARFTPFALAVVVWGIQALLSWGLGSLYAKLAVALPVTDAAYRTATQRALRKTADINLGALPPDSEKDREQLLNRYHQIEKALKTAKRKACAFLSVDVVGSTKMKVGVEETDVALTFHAYEDMLKKIFKQFDAWKQAWTPDGVMICFLQRELAVGAAKRILQSLDNFNAQHNRLRTPFKVRCGINEGEVPIYQDTNLERVADRVIDVAGHMQKEARVNTLWLSHEMLSRLEEKAGFCPVDKKVDGFEVYEWSLEHEEESEAVARPAAAARPAAPSPTQTAAAPSPVRTVTAPPPPVAATGEAGEGQRVGRYEIISELGRGAMGAVYKARDPQIGRTVAIKLILTQGLSHETIEEYKQRFYREAQSAGQMSHPSIVTIHDIGEDAAGQPFLVMEFLEGQPLDKAKPPLKNALDIGRQLAEALDYAHNRGIVHRDLKPANIMLADDGTPKILDFGIAQLSGSQLTRVGQLLGTPAFMSPEQFAGAKVDARSDLFSLGTILYWLCTGKNPFMGKSLSEVALKVMQAKPEPPRKLNPDLPEQIDGVVARCLAKDSTERYSSGRALAADLKALKEGRPVVPA